MLANDGMQHAASSLIAKDINDSGCLVFFPAGHFATAASRDTQQRVVPRCDSDTPTAKKSTFLRFFQKL